MPVPVLTSLASKSGESLGKIEELWSKAKARAKEESHDGDYSYITGILKRMLGLGEVYSPDDAVLTTAIVGERPAQKLLTEEMPPGVRQNLFQKYVNMELQLRRKVAGKEMNWNFFLRSLREAVILLLNWAAMPESVKESVQFGDMRGLI